MGINWREIEREEQAIDEALASGEITSEQARHEHRELNRDIQAAYEEHRQEAIDEFDPELGLLRGLTRERW